MLVVRERSGGEAERCASFKMSGADVGGQQARRNYRQERDTSVESYISLKLIEIMYT